MGAVYGFARTLLQARAVTDLRRRVLAGLAELVSVDLLTWDVVELDTGAVRHQAIPADAEPPGAFAAVVGDAAGHPLLSAHAAGAGSALRLSEVTEPGPLSHSDLFGDLLKPSGVEYCIAIGVRAECREIVVAGLGRGECEFSERDRDVLDLVRPAFEDALRDAEASERLDRALAADPPPGTAVVLLDHNGEIQHSSAAADRWLAENFGPPEHPGWLPRALAEWLALPPRPPLVTERDGRRLTVRLVPGDPHALLLEEEVACFRRGTLHRLGLTARETEVLSAASHMPDEVDIAWELSLSPRAVRDRLAHLEAKLGVRTASEAVAVGLRESA